jgi:hypothetical protein
MLMDSIGRQDIQASRPTVVKATDFVEKHIGKNLKKLDTLHDDASDEGLARAKNAEELQEAIDALPRHENAKPAKAAAKAKE